MLINTKTSPFFLLLTATLWGLGFIGTQGAIDAGLSATYIIASRFLIASLILLVFYYREIKKINKNSFKISLQAGIILFFAFLTQTIGQKYTSISNSSFITATNVVLVPFIVWFFTKNKPPIKFIILTFTSLLGSAVLTLNFDTSFSLNIGDALMFLSAALFALHITFLGTKAKEINSKQLTFLQLLIAGLLALVLVCFDNTLTLAKIKVSAPYILFLAIFPSCICYFLQTEAQKFTRPTKAGIILCLEGFFGSFFALIFGLDQLTIQIVIGGIIIISSVIMTEVNFKKKKS